MNRRFNTLIAFLCCITFEMSVLGQELKPPKRPPAKSPFATLLPQASTPRPKSPDNKTEKPSSRNKKENNPVQKKLTPKPSLRAKDPLKGFRLLDILQTSEGTYALIEKGGMRFLVMEGGLLDDLQVVAIENERLLLKRVNSGQVEKNHLLSLTFH